jgi:hypothetical protein
VARVTEGRPARRAAGTHIRWLVGSLITGNVRRPKCVRIGSSLSASGGLASTHVTFLTPVAAGTDRAAAGTLPSR